MSKAEERALEAYPSTSHYWNAEPDRNAEAREFYKQGYKQAEKDLELSWEDIERIDNIILILNASIREESRYMDDQEFYREVLERFKERE